MCSAGPSSRPRARYCEQRPRAFRFPPQHHRSEKHQGHTLLGSLKVCSCARKPISRGDRMQGAGRGPPGGAVGGARCLFVCCMYEYVCCMVDTSNEIDSRWWYRSKANGVWLNPSACFDAPAAPAGPAPGWGLRGRSKAGDLHLLPAAQKQNNSCAARAGTLRFLMAKTISATGDVLCVLCESTGEVEWTSAARHAGGDRTPDAPHSGCAAQLGSIAPGGGRIKLQHKRGRAGPGVSSLPLRCWSACRRGAATTKRPNAKQCS